jgi:hypothetical protein
MWRFNLEDLCPHSPILAKKRLLTVYVSFAKTSQRPAHVRSRRGLSGDDSAILLSSCLNPVMIEEN